MLINPNMPYQDIVRLLMVSGKFSELEAQQIALSAKVGYSNFERFEQERKSDVSRIISLAQQAGL